MRVVVLHNPKSGRARGAVHVRATLDALSHAGVVADVLAIDASLRHDELCSRLRGTSALVIAGGDGSIHHSAPAAIAAQVPIYHVPLGTENLFAREFGMSRRPEMLIEALHAGRVRTVDAAACNDRTFVLMASIGFDAAVVRRVAAARDNGHRNGGVHRMDYIRRACEAISDFDPPRITIVADGREVVRDELGLAIIANSRQYAARLDPASKAEIDDGFLDLLFFSFSTRRGLARWLISIAARTHLDDDQIVHVRVGSVTVRSQSDDAPLQLDGESIARIESPEYAISVRAGVLPVLVPSPSH